MRLYFVRHGESEANIVREFSNRGFKHPLTSRGVAQATALAALLAGHKIERIYCSPLQRAVQTAEILAEAWGLSPTITDALREWDVGIYEGTTSPEGWVQHRWVQDEWFIHRRLEQRLPEGESFLDMYARFAPFVQGLVQKAPPGGGATLLVGHGGLFHAMLPAVLPNLDYAFTEQHPLSNTAYVLAEADATGLHCREWYGIVPN